MITQKIESAETTSRSRFRQTSLFEFEQHQPDSQLTEGALQDVERIAEYLAENIDGVGFIKSREIATEIGLNVSTVGALISDVDGRSDTVAIESYARTNATTWRVEVSA